MNELDLMLINMTDEELHTFATEQALLEETK